MLYWTLVVISIFQVKLLQYLPARRRQQGLVVIGVCLCVCAHCFCPQDISRTGLYGSGSPPNLVGGTRGREPVEEVQFWC